ncbi:glycosyltransferase [Kaistella carnis]|uniref:Glycosyltransferase n=1 Tax=Kaistella carnis TaxID=1241979 RepID=A0A3G8XKI5_9FLAO|nr:glycosyltransferase [Kaistella carnis]AZI33338.1 glycosyltransferase [Kaistella carnis]
MKMINPLVTISIPLYNCADFLEACLESVRLQTYAHIEVTLINDQTPDNSVQIAEEFIQKHQLENWRIIHLAKNSGLSVVRNKGIDTALGKYIFFVDSDDVITRDCVSKLVVISENSGAEVTMSQLECVELKTGKRSICIKLNSEEKLISGNINILTAFSNNELVSYSVNKLFLVDFIRKNSIYFTPGLFAEDELWNFQMILKLNKVAIHKDVTYTYFLHQKSIIHNRDRKYFNNWFTIAKYVDEALKTEDNNIRKALILRYLISYKSMTLMMNWRAKKDEQLWKESYCNYKTLSGLHWSDYFSTKIPLSIKKADLLNSLPTDLGFRFFKWRWER